MVTGHDGYIGTVLVPMLIEGGHHVVGLDSGLFRSCGFGPEPPAVEELLIDIRDVEPRHFEGIDVVMHLAGLSNDPSGDLNPEATDDINHRATIRVAEAAKAAGVERFLFSSSCSIYGAQGDDELTESASFAPVTPYGRSKEQAEADLVPMADDAFSPVYLRNATAYGVSARLRGDLAVNNLTGFAHSTGKVFLKSDGSSWRPLVHIEDIARAFCALAVADRSLVHNEAFNVGATAENYQIRDVAQIVAEVVPDCEVTLSDQAFNDPRNYRVNCDKLATLIPDARPRWTVRRGVEQLRDAMVEHGLTLEQLEGPRYRRDQHLRALQEQDRIDEALHWIHAESEGARR